MTLPAELRELAEEALRSTQDGTSILPKHVLQRLVYQLQTDQNEMWIHLGRAAQLEARNKQLEEEVRVRCNNESQLKARESKVRDTIRLESIGTLAAGIAHDFNNLLVSVLGNSDLMSLAPDLPEHLRVPLAEIKHAGRRAADLTQQMLMFAGQGRPILSRVSLPLVVLHGLESVRHRASERVQFETEITVDLLEVDADRNQLHQVVMNLLNNAIEAIDDHGVIAVGVTQELLSADELSEFQFSGDALPGVFAVLRVQDSGPGISAEIVSRIFDPFFTTKFTGRGLGLATVFGVVVSHRGAIRVRTPSTGGTVFEIALPRTTVLRDSGCPRQLADAVSPGTGCVLLIDDDDRVRSVMAQLLAVLGYSVTTADGGKTGLELFAAKEASFDLVVVDWQMPGLSGEQVLKSLREQDPDLPMILISGYCTDDLSTSDAHLTRLQKPMTLGQLREAIRTVRS